MNLKTLLLASALLAAPVLAHAASNSPCLAGPATYIAANGSDSNTGTSPASPFKTFDHAELITRLSTSKLLCLMGNGGSFTYANGNCHNSSLCADISTTAAGEQWLAYPGQTPVIDGAGTMTTGIYLQSNNMTFRWITLQNFTTDGFEGPSTAMTGETIADNTITGITSGAVNEGAIHFDGGCAGCVINHNAISSTNYDGILLTPGTAQADSRTQINFNTLNNLCLTVADCGAIHINDRQNLSIGANGQTSGAIISGNVISNFTQSSGVGGVGIYLDDFGSNDTITNNVIYGTGQLVFHFHAGNQNAVTGNIIDISSLSNSGSQTQALVYHQYEDLTSTINSGTYNTSTGVIVLTMSASSSLATGIPVQLTGLTGTGGYATLLGTWVVSAVSGSTVTLAGPTGAGTSAITGGTVHGYPNNTQMFGTTFSCNIVYSGSNSPTYLWSLPEAYTATASGTVLTETGGFSGNIKVGDWVQGPGITGTPYIASLGSGTGQGGTYNLSTSQTIASPVTLYDWVPTPATLSSNLYYLAAGGTLNHTWAFPDPTTGGGTQDANPGFTNAASNIYTFTNGVGPTIGSCTNTWPTANGQEQPGPRPNI